MTQGDRELLAELLTRMSRIENALLGDPDHNIWGYKGRLEHLEKKQDDFIARMEKGEDRIKVVENALAIQKGFKFTVVVLSGLIGVILGVVLTFLLGGS